MKDALLCCLLLLGACSSPDTQRSPESDTTSGQRWERLDLELVEDNVRHDTLLTQVTFALPGGDFLMVASNVKETFEGLRLYRYEALPDSSARVLAVSPPAYDSWTMLPTVFRSPTDPSTLLILANFGERQSWGQKVLRLDDAGFTALGFLDVALPVRIQEEDTALMKLHGAGSVASASSTSEGWEISFATDSLFLYDDMNGGRDVHLPGASVVYRITADKVLLVVNGEAREVKPPA